MDLMQRRRELMAMQSELPGTYRRVEYIASSTDTDNSGQYINTGLIPNDRVRIECEFEYLTVKSYQALFGAKSRTLNFGNANSSTLFRVTIQSVTRDINTSGIVNHWNMVMDMGSITLGGTTVTWEAPVSTADSPIWLFGRSTSSGALDATSSIRIYYFKIYDGNSLVRNLIPCVRKSDSKPGMYDTVTKTFYTNAGTGEFVVPTA